MVSKMQEQYQRDSLTCPEHAAIWSYSRVEFVKLSNRQLVLRENVVAGSKSVRAKCSGWTASEMVRSVFLPCPVAPNIDKLRAILVRTILLEGLTTQRE